PVDNKLNHKDGNKDNVTKKLLKDSAPFWKDMMPHPNRDDFWKERNIIQHLKNVAPAVMVVGGWYDAEDLYGSFKTYQSIEKQNPKVNNVLVVGPWHHGGWSSTPGEKLGPISFGSKTAEFYRGEVEFPFFEKYLKDKPTSAPAEATVFETGSNSWRTFDAWPPKHVTSRPLYLSGNGSLTFDAPKESSAYDEYISDLAKQVPFMQKLKPQP